MNHHFHRCTYLCLLSILPCLSQATEPVPHFAEGVKVGEATQDSAIVWVRLSAAEKCDEDFNLPGVAGKVRVIYQCAGEREQQTPWLPVDPHRDYTLQVPLTNLTPGKQYRYRVDASNDAGHASFSGGFRTAPGEDSTNPVSFVVTTGQKYATNDSPGGGPEMYRSMLSLDPDFFIHTGDVVYYDNDTPPLATNVGLARLHWHRLFNLPRRQEFHGSVVSYFMKDDHDIIKNDCWPGQTYGDLTFARGVELFNEQTPSGPSPYRTVTWGKHLQVWLMEGREYRSPNTMPDGPQKTIWGTKQIDWLKRGLSESKATFKVLVSPTPIVGPDRSDGSKNDNHANQSFQHEGEFVRKLLASQPNLYVACGDRHWQYVSEDPKTGLREYSCGPSTDQHSGGWRQDNVLPEHRFLRVSGGFLKATTSEQDGAPELTFSLHNTGGKVVYEETHAAK